MIGQGRMRHRPGTLSAMEEPKQRETREIAKTPEQPSRNAIMQFLISLFGGGGGSSNNTNNVGGGGGGY